MEMIHDYEKPLKGKVVGIPEEFWGEGMDPQVRESLEKSRELLIKAGMVLKPVRLPSTQYAVNVYYLIATSEAASNLSRFDGIRYGERKTGVRDLKELYEKSRGEGFGPEVKRRILLGTFALSAGYQDQYYRKAQKVQALIREEFMRSFSECDLLFAPVTPTPAFRFGEKISDPLSMYLSDIFTISANLAGLPALSTPSFPTSNGLPVGAQLIGPHWSEGALLKVASVLHEGVHPGLAPWKGGS
jgi:aspartyl-tRNA(Asn)/glutamyl-tRNA(Gln) amidotransferase subunit A